MHNVCLRKLKNHYVETKIKGTFKIKLCRKFVLAKYLTNTVYTPLYTRSLRKKPIAFYIAFHSIGKYRDVPKSSYERVMKARINRHSNLTRMYNHVR